MKPAGKLQSKIREVYIWIRFPFVALFIFLWIVGVLIFAALTGRQDELENL